MVRPAPINDCKRSYLGEVMPFPDIHGAVFVKKETVNGILCNYFLHEEHDIRVHMWLDDESYAPVRLLQESVDLASQESTPLLTYDYSNVNIGPIEDQGNYQRNPAAIYAICLYSVCLFVCTHLLDKLFT